MPDTLLFVAYNAGTVLFALWMSSRKGGQSVQRFLKADKHLPWYVVGASIISAGVSSVQCVAGTTATIIRSVTIHGTDGKRCKVKKQNTAIYDANTSNTPGAFGAEPGRYVVDRIEFGRYDLEGAKPLRFYADSGTNNDTAGRIGVDQVNRNTGGRRLTWTCA